MDYEKYLEEIKKALSYLREENKEIPIIVEGEKDINALKQLNIVGEIITSNTGSSLSNLCDKIASKYKKIIILTDWDKRGGYICHTIKNNLQGRVNCNISYRRLFAKNSTIRTIESLPSWIDTLKDKTKIL
jgi:5S rRNA maturation endonuclease (ribonuclease M5)